MGPLSSTTRCNTKPKVTLKREVSAGVKEDTFLLKAYNAGARAVKFFTEVVSSSFTTCEYLRRMVALYSLALELITITEQTTSTVYCL